MHDNLRVPAPAAWVRRPSGVGLATMAAALLSAWSSRRRQRRQLMELSDQLLKDIGISRSEAYLEGRKPFWRP